MVNGISNVDFMILFTYVSMASVLIRLVISVWRCGATRRVGVFSLNESPGNYLINQTVGTCTTRTCGHTAPYHRRPR